jgi:hypothetical protein
MTLRVSTVAILVATLFMAACASTEHARLRPRSEIEMITSRHDVAFYATIVSGRYTGRKYIENYLLGSVPKRARYYTDIEFRVDEVVKGSMGAARFHVKNLLVNGNALPIMMGDQYLVAFDGSAERFRRLTLVPIRINPLLKNVDNPAFKEAD